MFVTYHTSAIILNGTSDKTPSIAQHAYSRTVIVTVRRIRTGFLDDMSNSLNSTLIRGSAVAQRTGRIVRIKSDLSDLKHNRVDAVQQLGNKLYPFVANHPDLMATAGEEVRTIAGIDNQIAALEAERTIRIRCARDRQHPPARQAHYSVPHAELLLRGTTASASPAEPNSPSHNPHLDDLA